MNGAGLKCPVDGLDPCKLRWLKPSCEKICLLEHPGYSIAEASERGSKRSARVQSGSGTGLKSHPFKGPTFSTPQSARGCFWPGQEGPLVLCPGFRKGLQLWQDRWASDVPNFGRLFVLKEEGPGASPPPPPEQGLLPTSKFQVLEAVFRPRAKAMARQVDFELPPPPTATKARDLVCLEASCQVLLSWFGVVVWGFEPLAFAEGT